MYFLRKLEILLKGEEKKIEVIQDETPVSPTVKERKPQGSNQFQRYNSRPNNYNNQNNYQKKNITKGVENSESKLPNDNAYALYAIDGDTFEAMYQNKKTTFRLAGVDSPEKNQPYYTNAKRFLAEKINKKVVYLDFKGQDRYGRSIVEVFEDKAKKISINKQLIEEGFATSERYTNNQGEKTHNFLEHTDNKLTEIKAQLKGKGMWELGDKNNLDKPQPTNIENTEEVVPRKTFRKFSKS